MSIFCVSIKKLQMQCERLRDQDIMHAQCMQALQRRAFVGSATLIDYKGCGLIGKRGVRKNQMNYPWIHH